MEKNNINKFLENFKVTRKIAHKMGLTLENRIEESELKVDNFFVDNVFYEPDETMGVAYVTSQNANIKLNFPVFENSSYLDTQKVINSHGQELSFTNGTYLQPNEKIRILYTESIKKTFDYDSSLNSKKLMQKEILGYNIKTIRKLD